MEPAAPLSGSFLCPSLGNLFVRIFFWFSGWFFVVFFYTWISINLDAKIYENFAKIWRNFDKILTNREGGPELRLVDGDAPGRGLGFGTSKISFVNFLSKFRRILTKFS